jgi:hypothetical protein
VGGWLVKPSTPRALAPALSCPPIVSNNPRFINIDSHLSILYLYYIGKALPSPGIRLAVERCSREVGEAGITVSVGTDQYTPDHVSLALASIKGASVVRRTVRQFDTPLV